MPTVMLFFTLAVLLAIVLSIIVLLPWLRGGNSARHDELLAVNVDIFKQRIEELQTDFAAKNISQPAFESQKVELERQLLQATSDKSEPVAKSSKATFAHSNKAKLIVFLWVPVMMAVGYVMAGDRSSVFKLWQAQDEVGQVADDLLTGKLDVPPQWATKNSVGLLTAMQTNVYAHAYDATRWINLADVFLAFDANEQAMEALARAYRLQPDDEEIAVHYAQTQFFTSGGTLNQDSYRALQSVLSNNPNHQGAQMLMAMGEARSGNYDAALGWVDRLQQGISSREGDHTAALKSLELLRENIVTQKQTVGQQAENNNRPSDNQGANVVTATVRATITINPSVQPLIEPTDTLFVSISDKNGGPPVAVKRLAMIELIQNDSHISAFDVNLSDSDAMLPSNTLSSAINNGNELLVKARISKSGQAVAQTGDIAATPIPLTETMATQQQDNLDAQTLNIPITLEINHQVP